MSKQCIKCQSVLDDNAKFCVSCGTPQPVNMECPNCHAPVEGDVAFCTKCGARVKPEGPIPTVAPQQVQYQQPVPSSKKLSPLKWVGIVIGVLVCIFILIGVFSSKDSSSVSSSEPVKAQTIIEDYIRDTGSADKQYKDKKIKVTGQLVRKQQFNNSSNYGLLLYTQETGGKKYTLLVDIPADKASEANKVKVGDFVSAEGTCVGVVKQSEPTDISVQVQCDKIN